ncbi:MAG: class I SAM-dependent methyltransferase [Candidatus Woesearchaeota archaeon]
MGRKPVTKDIATVFSDAYSKHAPEVLGDQHRFLLDNVERFMLSREFADEDKSLLIICPGEHVLPYSVQYDNGNLGKTNRARIKRMLTNGRIVIMDYMQNALERSRGTLESLGFFDDRYFRRGIFSSSGEHDVRKLLSESISFQLGNLYDKLRFPDESVSCVDANLVVHHATPTIGDLERVLGEIHRVLEPQGMFHLGTVDVDMKYSEEKIRRVVAEVQEYAGKDVLLRDERDGYNGNSRVSLWEMHESYDNFPYVSRDEVESQREKNFTTIRINDEGMIEIRADNPQVLSAYLSDRGYEQMSVSDDSVSVPLIEPQMQEDNEGLIIPVDRFYDSALARVVRYKGRDDELVAAITQGIEFERANARRGLVEYYTGQEKLLRALEKVGFNRVTAHHHENGPFYNILAHK